MDQTTASFPQGADAAEPPATPHTPQPLDPMMLKVSNLVREQFDRQGWRFSIQGREMANADIASPQGLLSIVAYQAATLYEDMMGKPMPLYFYTNPDSLCEVSPAVEDNPHNTMIFWGHFAHYAMEEWVKRHPQLLRANAPIPLDDMYDRWFEAATAQKLEFREAMSPGMGAAGRSGGF